MLTVQDQITILVHLSKADKVIAESERELIHYLGDFSGLKSDEIDEIIDNPGPMPSLKRVSEEERFEYLLNVIQLMKIDGKVFKAEIDFCERLAVKLGYLPGVVADMSAYVYSDPQIKTKRSLLKSIADRNLRKKGD